MKNQLTVSEAIARGFTHWAFESDEPIMRKISEITDDDFDNFDGSKLMLVEPKSFKFTIDGKDIENLVCDYLCNQDEVADEDCELAELASEADFETLANDINKRMSVKSFYSITDIELVR